MHQFRGLCLDFVSGDLVYKSKHMKTLGPIIRRRREAKGLSIQRLALRAGVDRLTLLKIETNASGTRLTTLSAICRALDCPVSEIIAASEREACGC